MEVIKDGFQLMESSKINLMTSPSEVPGSLYYDLPEVSPMFRCDRSRIELQAGAGHPTSPPAGLNLTTGCCYDPAGGQGIEFRVTVPTGLVTRADIRSAVKLWIGGEEASSVDVAALQGPTHNCLQFRVRAVMPAIHGDSLNAVVQFKYGSNTTHRETLVGAVSTELPAVTGMLLPPQHLRWVNTTAPNTRWKIRIKGENFGTAGNAQVRVTVDG